MKVLFFDTESTDLAASWGRLLCYSDVDLEGNVTTFRADERPFRGRHKVDDSKLAVAIRDRLESADMIVGWNSILHDIPFINGRLAAAGERGVNPKRHLDLMWYSGGSSMKLGGRRLDLVAKYFKCNNQKTPLDGESWQLAGAGDKEALDSVVVHCEADVRVLLDLWPHLAPYVKKFVLPLSNWWQFIGQIEA